MQIEAIETFLVILREGSFHAAARSLSVAQTTVTARIRALEDRLGADLFTRDGRRVSVTDFGRQFETYAREMVHLWHMASRDLPGRARGRRPLRMGAALSIWDPLLTDLAVQLDGAGEDHLLTLNFDHTMDVHQAVAGHILDIALTPDRPAQAGLHTVALPTEILHLVEIAGPDGQVPERFIDLRLGGVYDVAVKRYVADAPGHSVFLGNCTMALRYLRGRGGRGFFPQTFITDVDGAHHLGVQIEMPLFLIFREDAEFIDQAEALCGILNQLRDRG
ncbi:LysR family transcriptional regulator [Halocynthiibacter styelae]|uniref:LysR family transcriptional regulator n=1 Tax=Halocynthiibacter styelae TaxID=2761955 RepID=A0A8J7LKL5_9RHOB|nr:LysR family transcriptional regulator [Paenihalocynthiibacter styelae]MBI1494255.1 LysR family transcriptional regulator [Paenihalocynthiibacter styelae]